MSSPETDRTKRQQRYRTRFFLARPGIRSSPRLLTSPKPCVTSTSRGAMRSVLPPRHGWRSRAVIAHTFGWDGRSCDAPGPAYIIELDGYREWLAGNQVTLPDTSLKYMLNLPRTSEDLLINSGSTRRQNLRLDGAKRAERRAADRCSAGRARGGAPAECRRTSLIPRSPSIRYQMATCLIRNPHAWPSHPLGKSRRSGDGGQLWHWPRSRGSHGRSRGSCCRQLPYRR